MDKTRGRNGLIFNSNLVKKCCHKSEEILLNGHFRKNSVEPIHYQCLRNFEFRIEDPSDNKY